MHQLTNRAVVLLGAEPPESDITLPLVDKRRVEPE
jgi:hypothetical protein